MAAGPMTKEMAEVYWNKYNKDGNCTLSVDEVKQAVQEVYQEDYDDSELKTQYLLFGQNEPKDLTKDEFIKGMMKTGGCKSLKDAFKEMDTDGSNCLTEEELKAGMQKQGFDADVAEVIMDELKDKDNVDGKFNITEFMDAVTFGEAFTKMYNF